MYGLRQFTSKILVWLAAVLVPVQALPAAPCCCSGMGRQPVDPQMQLGHLGPKTRFCYRSAPTQGASRCGENRPCCKKAGPTSTHRCWGCPDTCTCSCQQNDSPAPAGPTPTESWRQTLVQLVPLPAPVCESLGQCPPRLADEASTLSTSASERCVTLCRFRL